MTRPALITAGRPARPVRVETRRRWSRGDVHAMGTAAVADVLCRAGGLIDGKARARLLGIRRQSVGDPDKLPVAGIPVAAEVTLAVEKRDIGCATLSATRPENRADLSTDPLQNRGQIMPEIMHGALVDDVCRHIDHVHGIFRPALIGGVL